MQSNPLVAFLVEIFGRISAKSPKFFVVWQWISGAVVAVSGLPALLTALNVTLPPALTVMESKTVGIAASVAFFMSLMPAQSPTVSTSASGTPLKQTNSAKLPFTAQSEKTTSTTTVATK
jgi:hypothetical protein